MSKTHHICLSCNVKTYDWDKHVNTKKHVKLAEKSVFSKKLFDSGFISKFTPAYQFFPKFSLKRKCVK